jgi:Protein of unknown function (DUF2568)
VTVVRGVVLSVRFLCELAMLVALAYWGFHVFEGSMAYVAGVGLPLAAIVVWGEFVAPKARRPVSIPIRLVIEDALFVATTIALVAVDLPVVAAVFAIAALSTSWLNAWTEAREGPPP